MYIYIYIFQYWKDLQFKNIVATQRMIKYSFANWIILEVFVSLVGAHPVLYLASGFTTLNAVQALCGFERFGAFETLGSLGVSVLDCSGQ